MTNQTCEVVTDCQGAICVPPIKIQYENIGWFVAGSLIGSLVGSLLLKAVQTFRKISPELANMTSIDETIEKIASFLKFGIKSLESIDENDIKTLIKLNPSILAKLAQREDTENFGDYLQAEINKLVKKP